MLVGNPDYLLKNVAVSGGIDANHDYFKRALKEGLKQGTRGIEFAPLPGTAAEVANLEERFRKAGRRTLVILGADATESALRAARRPRILHLATHGFYLNNSVKESMLRGGLALAGAQSTINQWVASRSSSPENDGILTAAEATRLDLTGTQLVVLSACATALGQVTPAEGVLGLKRGFSVAGCENLMLTLWEIDDLDTVALMGSFYERLLKGEHPADALYAVQSEALVRLRKDRGLYHAINRAGPFVLNSNTNLGGR